VIDWLKGVHETPHRQSTTSTFVPPTRHLQTVIIDPYPRHCNHHQSNWLVIIHHRYGNSLHTNSPPPHITETPSSPLHHHMPSPPLRHVNAPKNPITSRPVLGGKKGKPHKNSAGTIAVDCMPKEERDLVWPVDVGLAVDQHTQHLDVSVLTCHGDWRGPVLQQNMVKLRPREARRGAQLAPRPTQDETIRDNSALCDCVCQNESKTWVYFQPSQSSQPASITPS
jgi:hypothetical protein